MTKCVAIKVGVVAAVLLALSAVDAAARTITIQWDASPDATVVGYRVYWATAPGAFNDTDYVDVAGSLTWSGDLPGDQYYFVVRAYDADLNLSDPSLEVGDTSSFWLSNPGDQSAQTGQAVDLVLMSHGAPVSYAADGLPQGLSLDTSTGQIFGTVTAMSIVQLVTARAVDATGHVSSVQFFWTVTTNYPPTVVNPGDQTNLRNDLVALQITAEDPNGAPLTYSAVNLPPGLTLDAVSGVIRGTVSSSASGAFNVTVSVSDGTMVTSVPFVWQIWSGDSLIVDRAVSADASGSSVTTDPFSTVAAGETLVAFVEAAEPTDTDVQTTVVSGGGLQWSLVARANAQAGTSEIWTAPAPARLSNVTVTADANIGGTFLSLTVVAFAGADGVGAAAVASAATGAPAVSLTTTRPGSLVFGNGNDWDGSVSRTIAAGQDLLHEWLGPAGDTFWVQRGTGAAGAAGTAVTIGDSEPTDHRWNFAAVEILGRGQAVPTVVLTPAIAPPASPLSAAIANAPGAPGDWVGLFRAGAPSTDVIARQFLNGSTTPPATGLTRAQLTFAAPAQPGTYNVRLFSAADPITAIAVSNTVVVPDSISISDASLREGDEGSASMIFTVTLAAPSPSAVTVAYATADGTAKAGSDYAARSGTLVFAPGTTTQTIAVKILGDKSDEADESFSVVLSGATNAVITDGTAVGTIVDDDEAAAADGQMFGFGAIADGRLRDRFLFRVAERHSTEYARLEFWASEPVKGRDLDDDDRPGSNEKDYRHDHRPAKNRFESTAVTNVTFGPREKDGRSVTFAGAGQWNGKGGYTFEARASDGGEPGRGRDSFSLVVKDSRGNVVLNVGGKLEQGNIQSVPASRR